MPNQPGMRIGQIPLSDNYRQAVGPEDKYDLIGAHQFCVLVQEGLREWHMLLDVGCGSLRGGKLFIPYLQANHYYGIEPNEDLVREGLRKELGANIGLKQPTFHYTADFDFSMFIYDQDHSAWKYAIFDFILAQSIFSHSTQIQAAKCIAEVARVLKPSGKFLATFFKGGYNDSNSHWSRPIVYRTSSFFDRLAKKHNLVYTELDIVHPGKQTWFKMEMERED